MKEVRVEETKVPSATPFISKFKNKTKNRLKIIFETEKKTTTTLDVLVFCNPINNPVMTKIVNSPKAE